MATWAFYQEAALTNAYTAFTCTATTSTFHVWLGSATTGRKIVSTTTGGNLSIAVADSTTGGHATTAVKLATTTGGIAGATPGAALTIGSYLNGGTSGAFSFVAQFLDAVGDGVYDATISLYVAPGAKEQAVT
jgi:hypothetical protein